VKAVMTVERAHDKPFTIDEIETLRVTADLCTARLLELKDHDKWVGAKMADGVRRGLSALLGPRYTWVKALVVGVFLAGLLITLYPAPWRVDAHVEVQAVEDQVIAAPFMARIEVVHVKPGDKVIGDKTPLATLETAELRASLAKAESAYHAALKAADVARKEGEHTEMQIQELKAKEAGAQIDLLEYKIEEAVVKSPISGTVVEGDLEGMEGITVSAGDVLMRVADITQLRAELLVPEKRIGDLVDHLKLTEKLEARRDSNPPSTESDGELATQAFPGVYIPFTVDRVSPIAELIEQRNVFRIWVTLQTDQLENRIPLTPGFEGVAKINVDTASYAWLWTRDLVHWVRMQLWW